MGIEDTIDEKAKQLANQNDVATSGEVTEIINGMLKQSEIDKQKEEERIRKYNSLPSVLMRTIKRKSVYMSLIAITAVSVWSSIYFSDYNVAGRKAERAIALYSAQVKDRNSLIYLIEADNELSRIVSDYQSSDYSRRTDLKQGFINIKAEVVEEIRIKIPQNKRELEEKLYNLYQELSRDNNQQTSQEEWDSRLKEAETLKAQMKKHDALSKRYLK